VEKKVQEWRPRGGNKEEDDDDEEILSLITFKEKLSAEQILSSL
jgi:hypothetical protein